MMRRGSSASWSKGMGSILGITYLLSAGALVSALFCHELL
jgi:hypothetical protein